MPSTKNILNIGSVKDQSKTTKILEQTGARKSIKRDASRIAKLPGKRVSRNGNIYWETRKNRSDKALKRI